MEEALADAGAVAGAEVAIGADDDAVIFDWEPRLPDRSDDALGSDRGAGGAVRLGPRGTDRRLRS